MMQLTKLARILGGLSLMSALIIAGNSVGDGSYEVNIYQVYEPLFWIFLGFTFVMGFAIIFAEIYADPDSYRWVYGFLLVAGVNVLLLGFPVLRDYFVVGQWDSVNHLRFVEDVLQTGKVAATNFYPVSHILAAMFTWIAGTSTSFTIAFFPLLFYVLYLCNTAFLVLSLRLRPSNVGMVMALASILVYSTFSTNFRPVYFTVLMLPLALGTLFRARSTNTIWADRLLFVALLFYVAFLHPLGFLVIAFTMIVFGVLLSRRGIGSSPEKRAGMMTPIGILLITWLTWFMTFRLFGNTLNHLIESIFEGVTDSRSLESLSAAAQRANLSLSDIGSMIAFNYGPMLLLLGLAGLAVVWALVRRRKLENYRILLLATILFFMGLAALSLFRDLFTGNPSRYANFAMVGVPLLAGGILYEMAFQPSSDRRWSGRIARTAVLLAVSLAAILSIFTIYFSPLNGQPSHMYSHAQKAGLARLVEKAVDDGRLIYSPFRGAAVLSGVLDSKELYGLRRESPRWRPDLAPAHFGYEPSGPDDVFIDPGYMWVTAHEMAYYTEVWPEGGRFTTQDFQRLREDDGWHQVYSSGGITIWRKNLSEVDTLVEIVPK